MVIIMVFCRLTLGGDQESKAFFCDAELALFKLRLENMVVDESGLCFSSQWRNSCASLKEVLLVLDSLPYQT
ncbi:hypothetical protein BsWGS_13654 [Bradybaena similaris]